MQNNLINRIDPTGMLDDPIHDSNTGEFLGHYDDSDFDGKILFMDKETYMNITNGEDIVIAPELAGEYGSYLKDLMVGKKVPTRSDLKLTSNVFTSLMVEADKQGLIDFDASRLKGGAIAVSANDGYSYPEGRYYSGAVANTGPIESDGPFKVRTNIAFYDKKSNLVTLYLQYVSHADSAISILGIHEYELHGVARLQGDGNHPIIYPIQWERSKGYISEGYRSVLYDRACPHP